VNRKRWLWILAAALLIAAVLLWIFVLRPSGDPKGSGEVQVILDGKPMAAQEITGSAGEDLRVYITLDGKPLLDLPFAEVHTVRIVQPDGGENTVMMTGSSVYMTEANCEGQDCVQMGEVTRENLEVRVMGGFIICLPHRISVEVR
jgi:hypothetical protein